MTNATPENTKGGIIRRKKKDAVGPKAPVFNLKLERFELAVLTKKGPVAIADLTHKTTSTIMGRDEIGNVRFNPSAKFVILGEGSTKIEDFLMAPDSLVQRNAESMESRALAPRETIPYKLPVKGTNGMDFEMSETSGYDMTRMITLGMVDAKEDIIRQMVETIYPFPNKKSKGMVEAAAKFAYGPDFLTQILLRGVFVKESRSESMKLFRFIGANPSQERVGEATLWLVGEGTPESLVPLVTDVTRAVEKEAVLNWYHGMHIVEDFAKTAKADEEMKAVFGDAALSKFNVEKDAKRPRLGSSGSHDAPSFNHMLGKMEQVGTMPYKDAGGVKTAKIYQSLEMNSFGFRTRILLIDDLEIEIEAEIEVYSKNKKGTETIKTKVVKNGTDGFCQADISVMEGLVHDGVLENSGQSAQIRGSGGTKGMLYGTPELFERTGFHVVMYSGARKLNIERHLRRGTYKLAVMNATRNAVERELGMVATQALLAIQPSVETLETLTLQGEAKIRSAMHDAKLAMALLKMDDSEESLTFDLEEADMESALGIQELLRHSPQAIQDATVKRRLAQFLTKSMEKISGGHVLVEGMVMSHMATDLFATMCAIENLVKDTAANVALNNDAVPELRFPESIRKNTVVTPAFNLGELGMRIGKILLVRYPCLLPQEVRKLDATDKLGSEEARRYYQRYIAEGFFAGVTMFSLYDFNPEAMSGADYDGDQNAIITNPLLMRDFENARPFLDKFITRDEKGEISVIGDGCPYGAPGEAPDITVVAKHLLGDIPVYQVKKNGLRTWELVFRTEDVQQRGGDVYFIMHALATYKLVDQAKKSPIGEWTNRLMIVLNAMGGIKLELAHETDPYIREKLIAEYNHYEKTAKILAAVVRWAIDEAKHGGAYVEHLDAELAPFLGMNEGEFKQHLASPLALTRIF